MAVVEKFDNAKPFNYARCVGQSPPGLPNIFLAASDSNEDDDTTLTAYDAVLDDRYKEGGSTTWERPAATG